VRIEVQGHAPIQLDHLGHVLASRVVEALHHPVPVESPPVPDDLDRLRRASTAHGGEAR
jgi:hypothetical protein